MPVPIRNGEVIIYTDNNGTAVKVAPNTIGQWIGIFTDDHFPIFENDTVEIDDELYRVSWSDSKAGFIAYNDTSTIEDWSEHYIWMHDENV